jgi:protocatechuate 3,4-dioxygenase beta subunit
MQEPNLFEGRRRFIRGIAFGVAGFSVSSLFNVPGLFAEQLMLTPSQGEGPFYPDHLPLDTDNDLLTVNDSITPAVGQVTHLGGRILTAAGEPIRNTLVEIWQVDNYGVYLHTDSNDHDLRDQNFQGFGRFLTGSTGEYYFRTIRPVVYGNRTSHIHFAIKMKGRDKWTTQMYVKGEPRNKDDRVLNRTRDPKAREAVTVDFAPLHGSRVGELAARFDVVLGFTPEA